MTLNGMIALILHYFTEFSSFWGQLRQSRGTGAIFRRGTYTCPSTFESGGSGMRRTGLEQLQMPNDKLLLLYDQRSRNFASYFILYLLLERYQ